ncbi:hypothetical protein AB0N62_45245 [Streptomyces sp. NPDC093982]|uniref:hypothetical protein n=1 Tax=Streptomyces sp. NPDC093982 TaxID=3155077 RepID=UPI00343390B5
MHGLRQPGTGDCLDRQILHRHSLMEHKEGRTHTRTLALEAVEEAPVRGTQIPQQLVQHHRRDFRELGQLFSLLGPVTCFDTGPVEWCLIVEWSSDIRHAVLHDVFF